MKQCFPERKEFKPPCAGCEIREVGCHGKCDLYKEWVSEKEKRKEQIKAYNEKHGFIDWNSRYKLKLERNK